MSEKVVRRQECPKCHKAGTIHITVYKKGRKTIEKYYHSEVGCTKEYTTG